MTTEAKQTDNSENLVPGKARADTRVVVAMSGGVDSSVTAAMLADQGYEVIGITLQLYDHGQALAKKGACCAGADIHDAQRVAESIGIPHYVLDYENRFRESVMDDFADSYLRGETPIPCVRCNQTVKFRDLLDTARDLGADCLATGHYIQRFDGDEKAELHAAVDPGKDQSYFLFATTQEQLDYLRFPLGGLEKSETRALAEKYALSVALKPDSQDICFVPNGDYASVIDKLRPGAVAPGDIVHLDGRVLGHHEGVIRYTIGQRRGLGIGGGHGDDNDNDPFYVVRIDADKRQVIVGPRSALGVTEFTVHELNWLGGDIPEGGLAVSVKIRSTRPAEPARIWKTGPDSAKVQLDEPEEGVSPGQACVVYDGSQVLGGGWMRRIQGTSHEGTQE
jgi:tRNA-uridine 2-sulfurtransferase